MVLTKPLSFEQRIIKGRGYARHLRWDTEVKRAEKKILNDRRRHLDVDAKRRVDLCHLNSYAIDGPNTKVLDDAISYDWKSGRVLVHIADPSAYFRKKNDPIIREAMRRVSSIFLTETQLPMLPMKLNDYRFSLNPKKRKVPALTFSFRVRENGSIQRSSISIKSSYIRLEKLSTDKANKKIQEGRNKDFKKLDEITTAMGHYRRKRIRELHSRAKIKYDGKAPKKKKAEKMVEELMIATNTCAGIYATRKRIPVLFDKLELNSRKEKNAKVSVDPGTHFDLGVDTYVRVTSPLRYAPALISHFQIKARLRGEKPPFSRSELSKKTANIQQVKKEIIKLQKYIDKECEKQDFARIKCKRR